jgi:hypothetical protein
MRHGPAFRAIGLVAVAVVAQGCAGMGLTLLTIGAGIGAGTGTSHILDSIAYKTFATPLEILERATVQTLRRLDMPVKSHESTDARRLIVARAGERTVEIELDRLTAKTARMRVDVRQNWLLRDRATAVEIIAQTDQTLDREPRLSRGAAR